MKYIHRDSVKSRYNIYPRVAQSLDRHTKYIVHIVHRLWASEKLLRNRIREKRGAGQALAIIRR